MEKCLAGQCIHATCFAGNPPPLYTMRCSVPGRDPGQNLQIRRLNRPGNSRAGSAAPFQSCRWSCRRPSTAGDSQPGGGKPRGRGQTTSGGTPFTQDPPPPFRCNLNPNPNPDPAPGMLKPTFSSKLPTNSPNSPTACWG